MQKLYLVVLEQNKHKNTLVGVMRTNITLVTHSSPSSYVNYTPHSGDKALTRAIWVLRKPTRVFLLYIILQGMVRVWTDAASSHDPPA